MLLRNTREPYDVVQHDHEDRIKFLLKHGYVEVDLREPVEPLIHLRKRKEEKPPADLGELADDLSKGEGGD